MVVRWFRPLKYLVGWLEVPLKYLWNTTINNISHPQSQRRQKRADEEMFVCTPIWARRLKTYSWVSISSSWLNISARLFGHKLLVMCKCTKCNIRVHGFAFNIIRSQQSVDPVVHMLHQLAMCVCLKGWCWGVVFFLSTRLESNWLTKLFFLDYTALIITIVAAIVPSSVSWADKRN